MVLWTNNTVIMISSGTNDKKYLHLTCCLLHVCDGCHRIKLQMDASSVTFLRHSWAQLTPPLPSSSLSVLPLSYLSFFVFLSLSYLSFLIFFSPSPYLPFPVSFLSFLVFLSLSPISPSLNLPFPLSCLSFLVFLPVSPISRSLSSFSSLLSCSLSLCPMILPPPFPCNAPRTLSTFGLPGTACDHRTNLCLRKENKQDGIRMEDAVGMTTATFRFLVKIFYIAVPVILNNL